MRLPCDLLSWRLVATLDRPRTYIISFPQWLQIGRWAEPQESPLCRVVGFMSSSVLLPWRNCLCPKMPPQEPQGSVLSPLRVLHRLWPLQLEPLFVPERTASPCAWRVQRYDCMRVSRGFYAMLYSYAILYSCRAVRACGAESRGDKEGLWQDHHG